MGGYLCYVTGNYLGSPRSPDLHVTIEDLPLADSGRFASRTTVTGTQRSQWGMPPTRRHISLKAVDIGRIADGQAHERQGGLNMYAVLTQLDGTRHSLPPSTWHAAVSVLVTGI